MIEIVQIFTTEGNHKTFDQIEINFEEIENTRGHKYDDLQMIELKLESQVRASMQTAILAHLILNESK